MIAPAGAPAPHPRPLYDRIASALLWLAALSFATGVFFSLTLWFGVLPPVKPVAVGVVTIQRYSKLRDYLGAGLFMTLVPALTVWFRRVGERLAVREGHRIAFALPFLLSPLFYLTTGKVGWILILPLALAFAATRTLRVTTESAWLRRLFARDLHPYHALLFSEAMAWIIFRYIVTGRRIAHFPTLFLELVFVALFLALFWCVALLVARIAEVSFGAAPDEMFKRITTAAVPLVALPLVGLIWSPTPFAWAAVIVVFLIVALLASRLRTPLSPRAAWAIAAYVTIPILMYYVSYASSAHTSQWIDLFHRGESIGPASDYLRGKAPYRGVFALHGMLEDGLLDAWLMQLFGRSFEIAVARQAILGAFLGVSIWYLGIIIFESIPLALIVTAMGAWTTAENNRTFFQVAAVALFWNALRRRNRFSAVASGVFAAIALFFSYEIGIYTIAGAIAAAFVLWIVSLRVAWDGLPPLRVMLWFLIGVAIGAAPFVIYLASRGALADFATVSFVTIPKIIDAVWSLPFPDLVSTFRKDLNVHTLADFVLFEKFHLILSPLAIAVAATYYLQRVIRRRTETLDHALAMLTVFCAIAQRTAFGRAEFRHQYFAAFLTGPILVLLAMFAVRRLREPWREGGEGTRAFIAAIGIGVVPIIALVFWIPDLINARIDDVINYQRRVINIIVDPRAGEVQARIDEVTKEIHALTRQGDPIFDFSSQPAFYFFVDRPNPTRFYQVPIASPREFQSEVIATLERAKPKVIIRTSPENYDEFDGISNALRAQAVAAYIDDCYRFAKSVRGVEIWTRLPNARPAPLASYLWRVHIPDPKEVATTQRARVVFPVIGSVWGANGANWVSDLTLHNPLRESIEVSLRYVTGQNAIDRQLRLAPQQTMRWQNVVHNLFLQPDGIGTLWIVYRNDRVPVALIQTSDIAHGARASIQKPLGRRDAATALTDNADLTIAGIPVVGQRYVNVGVVNTGDIPATFRITARTPNGKPIGRPIESGIPEGQLWLTTGIEQELGVKIDESTTLRVSAIAGSGVAFASIVDPATGDSVFIAATPSQQ
jgi:hypothetical protein